MYNFLYNLIYNLIYNSYNFYSKYKARAIK